MRTTTIKTVAYQPNPVPDGDLRTYLSDELQRIAGIVSLLAEGHVETTYVAPVKPRAGDFRLADGTSWNPGSGAGFYGYYGGAWVKLG